MAADVKTKATKTKSSSTKVQRVKKVKKIVTEGKFYILATFNNTIVSVTDRKGNKLRQSSAGACGFRGSRKSTPYAAQVAAETVGNAAKELGMGTVTIILKGPGPGRESAVRAIVGLGVKVIEIIDETPIPHNGVRPKKRRRV